VKSKRTKQFRAQLDALPEDIRREAEKAYSLFEADPSHSSLNLEQVQTKYGPCYSARVGRRYRALAVKRTDHWLWFWIGSHAEYNQILK